MTLYKTLFILILATNISFAQNINYEMLDISLYRYPLKPLSKELKTYSNSIQELNAELTGQQKIDLRDKGLLIPGFERVQENGDIQLELVVSPLSITNKELKDDPFTNEKNGVKTIYHKYSYNITYAFPVKLRVTSKGEVITEQDLPAFFQTKYFAAQHETESGLREEYERDMYFVNKLKDERITERVNDLKERLSSHYGSGMYPQVINIGYVKDKKGEYEDLTRALSLMHGAFTYANNKENHADENFRSKITEAVTLFEKALQESSDDKKAQIDPKVSAMINYNIALAHYGLNDVTKAEAFIGRIQKAGNETEYVVSALRDMIKDKRARLIANGILEGAPIKELSMSGETAAKAIKKTARDFIVPKPGDTLDVQFLIPPQEAMRYGDSLWLQDQIVVLKNNKRVELYPGDIYGYSFKGVFRESLTWIKDMNTSPWTFEKKFCRRLVDGPIQIYRKLEVTKSFSDPSESVVAKKMYYKQDDRMFEVMFLNFNKGVSKVVKDYSELSERVKNGAFTRDQFVDVIIEYNQWKEGKAKI